MFVKTHISGQSEKFCVFNLKVKLFHFKDLTPKETTKNNAGSAVIMFMWSGYGKVK